MTPPLEGAHNLRALLRSGDAVMSGGKIIPIIAAANRAQSAELKAVINSDIAALINALDDMLMPIEHQVDELRQRVKKLEEGLPVSA